jgi:hypothetical protein
MDAYLTEETIEERTLSGFQYLDTADKSTVDALSSVLVGSTPRRATWYYYIIIYKRLLK